MSIFLALAFKGSNDPLEFGKFALINAEHSPTGNILTKSNYKFFETHFLTDGHSSEKLLEFLNNGERFFFLTDTIRFIERIRLEYGPLRFLCYDYRQEILSEEVDVKFTEFTVISDIKQELELRTVYQYI